MEIKKALTTKTTPLGDVRIGAIIKHSLLTYNYYLVTADTDMYKPILVNIITGITISLPANTNVRVVKCHLTITEE